MRIKSFLLQSFAQVFFPVFLVLFFIASVVVFIRIAGVTFVVRMDFLDLLMLYFYTLPTMLFFVIPLSFFVACAIGLSRLSFEYELPVLFALGMPPSRILRVFFPLALLASFSLLVLSLILTPLSDTAYRQFLEERKNNIGINLQAGEFGQKLGEWLVYVQQSSDNAYKNIVLLSLEKKDRKDGLILAKEAYIKNVDSVMEVLLRDGKIYRKTEEEIERIGFESMVLRFALDFTGEGNLSVWKYWKRALYENPRQEKTRRNLSLSVLLSLFPLASLFYFPLLGVKNPRYQKNYAILQAMAVVGIFFALVGLSATYAPLFGMLLLPISWCLGGYVLYRKFVARFY